MHPDPSLARYSCVLVRFVFGAALVLSSVPVAAQTLAGGAYHSVILKSDGTVWTIGHNGSGQLGDNTTTDRNTPIQVSGLTGVTAVAAGHSHSMAMTSAGNLYLWGINTSGALGDGTGTTRLTPVQSNLANVVAIAAGEYHSVALTSNGNVYAWGRNWSGQLGNGTTTSSVSPVLVTTGGAAVAAGKSFTLIVKTDGTVYGTGDNSWGQLGDGTSTSRTTLVQMSGITTAAAATAGASHSVILLSSGALKATGMNVNGELGSNSTASGSTSPVSVSNLTTVTAIAAGQNHTVARLSDGSVQAWGLNYYGTLGDGTQTSRNVPTSVSTLSSITKIGAGWEHSLAVSSTGVVFTWGRNTYAQLGDATTVNRTTPVAISDAGYEWKVGTPTFSVTAGTYATNQSVAVSVATPGATIRYTQNGNEPTEADASIASGSIVTVSVSQTLKAKAFKSGMAASSTTSAAYELKAASVSFSPAGGTYTTAQSVQMSTTTSGAAIRYTTDGTTPTTASALYSGAISVATTTVIKAIAVKTDWSSSNVATSAYTMNFGTLATPTADQGTGTYIDQVTVALSAIAGATIRYTTGNTAVQANSTIYTAPLAFDVTTTLRFKAFHPDYQPSAEVTATYTLAPAAPTFTPTGGTYVAGQLVTVTGPTTGSTIRYTLNGSEPATSDPVITSGSTLTVGNFTLKAKAWKTGTNPSATTSATYVITGTVAPPMIATGAVHSLAIRGDGVVWGWGSNDSGRLGDGTTTNRLLPVLASGLTGAVLVDGGGSQSHALLTGGSLWGFGYNHKGQIGDGTTTSRSTAAAIDGVSALVAVSGGYEHTLALKGDGSVYGWGYNEWGQVGDASTTNRPSPTAVSGLSSITAIAAGQEFSLALKQDGTIYSWGRNGTGQLGDGTTTNRSTPGALANISATAIAAGFTHALALLADGTVSSWGYNASGQLGDGSGTTRTSPVTVAGLADVIAIGAGADFSVALEADGTVWTWGGNGSGQLGDGTTTGRSAAAQVPGLSGITQIAVGLEHVLALSSTGVVYAWGRNAEGQLGDGTTTNRSTPTAISGNDMNWRVPTPTLSVASGLYDADQTVTVTIPDPNATLRYTITGVDPTSSDATVISGGTIAIAQSQTLKVSGWRTGAVTSVVVARTYELKAVTPSLTPGTGAYGSTQSVSISTTTGGATLRYTTDGTEPTTTSPAYTAAISVAATQTVKARAFKTGWTASDSGYAGYWISSGLSTVATPVITPTGGAQTSPPLIAMTTGTTGATIRYTVDGSTPTSTSPIFVYPFLVTATTTVKAKAFKAGFSASAVATTTFDVDASGATVTPVIVPGGGWFATHQTVAITGPSGSTLRYTTDGSDPTTSSTSITSGNTLTINKSQVLKVRAWASGLTESAIRRADFVVTGALSAGTSHSLALASDGGVWAFGADEFGQLGNGISGAALTPVPVLSGAIAIAAGDRHSLAVQADGTVWAWGDGTSGKLGNGGYGGSHTSPIQIAVTGATAVAAGAGHSLVLKSDGTVWAFGNNTSGQLGNGTTTTTHTAVPVTGITGIVAIAVGANSSYALQKDGAEGGILWAWGANSYGELGDGSTQMRTTPVRVTGVPGVTAIAAGMLSSFGIAIGADGQAYGWGRNHNAQLGIGVTADQLSATPLPAIAGGRLVGAGSDYAIAVDSTARAWAWGNSSTGALGVGPGSSQYDRTYTPLQSDVGGVLSVVAGDLHTLAIRPNGTVLGFGQNSGRLGNGSQDASIDGVIASGLSLADNTFLAGDADQDDLVTWREYLLGTDPLNADSNGNGVLDGHDVASGANAADPDTDDDGVPNWTERLNGTDPFNADTDGDSVSDLNDAFPLDPTRWLLPASNPSDTTAPIITLKAPVSARLIP